MLVLLLKCKVARQSSTGTTKRKLTRVSVFAANDWGLCIFLLVRSRVA